MAMRNRKSAETDVPINPPSDLRKSKLLTATAAIAMKTVNSTTIVEWPNEKKKPTATGPLFSCMSLRVTLSMADIWSASNAWRRPNV